MSTKDVFKLLAAIIVCEFAGLAGSVFTASAIPEWYMALAKPAWTPPAWVFAPVWTMLYTLMGVSLFLLWRRGSLENPKERRTGLILFFVQLCLNALWSGIFFGLRSPGAAFGEIILLWLAVLATIIAFAKISRPAAWLLAPYLAWVSFAAYLNCAIWMLNA